MALSGHIPAHGGALCTGRKTGLPCCPRGRARPRPTSPRATLSTRSKPGGKDKVKTDDLGAGADSARGRTDPGPHSSVNTSRR